MNHHIAQRLPAALAAMGVAVLAAACGSGPPASAPTTTTTTLPSSIKVFATTPTGAAGFEGPIYRIPVTPLAGGATTLPNVPANEHVIPGTVKISYRQFGSGPNLVLAMGEHGSMTWWDPQFLQALSANYRVTIFDDPAVGYSDSMSRPPSVQTYGDLMAGLIVSLGLSNVTVLGWGMGGEAALSFAEGHQGLAIGLVLVDATAGGTQAVRPDAQVAEVISSPTATMEQLSTVMYPAGAATERLAWLSDIDTVAPDDVISSTIVSQARAQDAFFADDRVARSLSQIDVSTLVITGQLDEVIPPQNSQLLVHAIRHVRLVVLNGAGYAGLFQDEPAFLDDLANFSNAVSTSTTTTTSP